jgi:putative nucleotidyltransferase with HDIG domain
MVPHPSAALRNLNQLGALEHIIPEVKSMQHLEQGPPHQFDVWQHTLYAVDQLDKLLQILKSGPGGDLSANMQFGLIAFTFAHLRSQLQAHVAPAWPNGRTHRALLILAALLHDVGKPAARQLDDQGHIHFYRHEQIGQELIQKRAEALRLSHDEANRLAGIVGGHMRPHWLSSHTPLSARSVYRFWKDTGPAGVDICLLAIADYLATHGVTLEQNDWIAYLETIRTLLERYFLNYESAVAPMPLLSGHDVMQQFGLGPGPHIGDILEHIREAQIEGKVSTYNEALDYVQRFLTTQPHD